MTRQRAARGVDALIGELARVAAERSWSVVRWITADDNHRARSKYDQVATRTQWVTYDMAPKGLTHRPTTHHAARQELGTGTVARGRFKGTRITPRPPSSASPPEQSKPVDQGMERQMYVPRHFTMEDSAEVDSFLGAHPSGQLVTVGPDGVPDATLVPYVLDRPNGSDSDLRVLAHVARANDHWKRIGDPAPGLFVVTSSNAYVSPSWYPSKRAHGRVVPTWNYSAVHLRGAVRVHDDADWLRDMVTRLTDIHEAGRENRWFVTDVPEGYLTGQLRAIVGIELIVQQVEAKAKLTQNRSLEDRWGTIAGLEAEDSSSSHEVAAAMRAVTPEVSQSAQTEGSS